MQLMSDVERDINQPEVVREVEQTGLSRAELVAALMEDSIGYLTPRSAEVHIKDWERGEKECFCERCLHVFKGDLQNCVRQAATRWQEFVPEERQEQLLERVGKISELDEMDQLAVGLMWPTMG